jgi:hypothetical protein
MVLSLAFLTGAILGMLAASIIGQQSCNNLEQFFTSYAELSPKQTYTWSGFFCTLWYFLRFPLLILLAGFSALGVFVIPAAMILKGFSFSFAVSSLVLLYGFPGLLAAGVCFGLADFVLIPILFLVGGWNWEISCHIAFGHAVSSECPNFKGMILFLGTVTLAISMVIFFSFRLLIQLLPRFVF